MGEWEEEFRRRFELEADLGYMLRYMMGDDGDDLLEELKQFIKDLLQKERERIAEELKGLYNKKQDVVTQEGDIKFIHTMVYSGELKDIIKKLKGEADD